jgi:hypothetical protein
VLLLTRKFASCAAVMASIALVALPGIAHATNWGFANGSMCDPWGSGDPNSSYLGPCTGSLDNGYALNSWGGAYAGLVNNQDIARGGSPTPIGQHSAYERFFITWDAAGSDTWNGVTSLGCVASSHRSNGAQSIQVLTRAVERAQANGETAVIAFGQDGSTFHQYDGLHWLSATSTDSYPSNAYVGQTPNAGGYRGTASVVNEYCGVYEALSYLASQGVNMGQIVVEPFNEPEWNGESAANAAYDYIWANAAAVNWGEWTLAGVFSGGGRPGYVGNYVASYMGTMQGAKVSPAHWSFHDYNDVANQDSSWPEVSAMKQALGNHGFSAGDIWITESGLNRYPNSGLDICADGTQAGQAETWLALLRSGQVAHVFWYDWPSTTGSIGGLYNANGYNCGSSPPYTAMKSYWVLDDQG